jgi:hypothetical protein
LERKIFCSPTFLPSAVIISMLSGCAGQASPDAGTGLPVAPVNAATLRSFDGPSRSAKNSIWSVIASPNDAPDSAGITDDLFYSDSGSSTSDVWAVGDNCCVPNGTQEYTNSLIEHWNGSAWSIVASPSNEPPDTQLRSVAAVSSNEAWAVGYSPYGTQKNQCVIEHWSANSWTVAPSPALPDCFLESVTVISAKDIWAAGTADFKALTEHWDGKTWSVVPSQTGNKGVTILWSVTAAASNDVWAVGQTDSPNANDYAEHWNGSAWTQAALPRKFFQSLFQSAVAVSSNDVWAVGYVETNDDRVPHTLIEHWNGSAWTVTKSPNMEPKGAPALTNQLWGVAARSANDVWAVGLWTWYTGDGTPRSLFEHWDGKKWRVASAPGYLDSNNNSDSNALNAITIVGGRNLWAVGEQTVELLDGSGCCEATLAVQTTHG